MTLADRLQADLRDAMRSGDTLRRDTLRMTMAALKNRRIELGQDLTDEDEQVVLAKSVKLRREAADQFEQSGRNDLAEKERAEAKLLELYLPAQLSDDEVRALVQSIIEARGLASKKDIGQVMKAFMSEHKGAADGKTVQRLANELLG